VVFDPPLASDPSADLLLSHPCADQRRLEAQLSCVRGSLAWHEKMLCAQLLNMLAPDQVAAWLLASWPFAPNAMTVSGGVSRIGGGGRCVELTRATRGGGLHTARGGLQCLWAVLLL
jgi:hypothetical protein